MNLKTDLLVWIEYCICWGQFKGAPEPFDPKITEYIDFTY